MASDTAADQLLEALGKEVMKVKRIYDGSNRVITQYEAFANAIDQAVCLKTDYTYVGATTDLDKMRESVGVWLTAYDI